MKPPRKPSLAFLTQPEQGVCLLNLQFGTGKPLDRIELSRPQLANIVVDGASIALRSVRLGPESLLPSPSYTEPA